jgi:hypothetical protein
MAHADNDDRKATMKAMPIMGPNIATGQSIFQRNSMGFDGHMFSP